jgi:hypothetical protein
MWEPQLLATLGASTTCRGKTLPYVGASTSCNPKGLHGLYRENITFTIYKLDRLKSRKETDLHSGGSWIRFLAGPDIVTDNFLTFLDSLRQIPEWCLTTVHDRFNSYHSLHVIKIHLNLFHSTLYKFNS